MTQDKIIEMAEYSGFDVNVWHGVCEGGEIEYSFQGTYENFEAFTKLVAQHKSDSLKELIENYASQYHEPVWAFGLIKAIQERGET